MKNPKIFAMDRSDPSITLIVSTIINNVAFGFADGSMRVRAMMAMKKFL